MERIKYPRTFHLPNSNPSSDDKVIKSLEGFIGKEVIITEKMDGENTSIYSDGYSHARSIINDQHESRDWLKSFASNIYYLIPEGMRICGENLYAKHSIYYENLESFFLGFSIWNDYICLSWKETLEIFNQLNIKTPKILYQGIYSETIIKELINSVNSRNDIEGFVIRISDEFYLENFSNVVAKYVRKSHITTDEHWKTSWIKNKTILKCHL